VTERGGNHLSSPPYSLRRGAPQSAIGGGDDVAIGVKQPTRGRAGHPWSPYLALLQVGFGRRCVTADDRTLLPSDFTLIRLRRTVCFCATFRPRFIGAWVLPSTLSSGARTFLPPDPPQADGAAVTRSTWPSPNPTLA